MALAIGKLQDAVYQNRPTNTDMNEATDKAIRPLSARVTALELQLAALCEVLDGRARAGVLPYAKSKAEAARELFRAGKTNAQRKGSARAAAVSPAHRQEARPGNGGNGPPQPSLEKKHPGHPAETRCFCCRWGEVLGAAVERCCRFGPLRWPGLPPPCRVSAVAGAVGSTSAAARCCGCGAVCGGRGGALHRRCRAGRAAARGILLWRSAAAVAGAVGSTSAATPACRWRWTCRRGGGLGRAL